MANLKPDVRVFQDLETLSQAAANAFVDACGQAVDARGRFLVALSGGSTPIKLYELLAASPWREGIDWSRLHVFWGDERCVPVEDIQNNYRQAHDILLGKVPLPGENVHRIRSELEAEMAADDYALVLRKYATPPLDWPRFDLVLLGMGEDAHTASLFPGSPVESSRPTMAVSAQYQDRPAQRVTLTPEVFNSARQVIFLVSGKSKSRMVADVLYGEYRPELLPAQRIRPQDGQLIWMLDQGASTGQ